MLIPQVDNRHQVEIGQSTIFRNNLEILFFELGNSVLKYLFFSELGKGQVRTLVENVLIPQVGNRHQVEIGPNKSTIFRNNLEILFLELGNSVLKYLFFSELGKGQVRTLVENVLIPQVGNRHQVEIGPNKSRIFRNNLEILFLELGNSVLKYFFLNLQKGKLGHLLKTC